jgi:hypothetical protein
MTVNIKIEGLDQVKSMVGNVGKQARYAAAVALTRTAKAADKRLVDDMQSTLDKPSPYTTRGTYSTSATPNKLEAVIGLKDKGTRVPPALLLKEHFSGGARGSKPFELALAGMGALPRGWRAIPGQGMPLDSYGNPKRTTIREMLGALKSRMKTYKGRGKRMQMVGYFVIPVGAKSHLHPGIYWQSGRAIKPMMVFVQAAAYRKVIDLPRSAAAVVHRDFDRLFTEAFEQAMRTAK